MFLEMAVYRLEWCKDFFWHSLCFKELLEELFELPVVEYQKHKNLPILHGAVASIVDISDCIIFNYNRRT